MHNFQFRGPILHKRITHLNPDNHIHMRQEVKHRVSYMAMTLDYVGVKCDHSFVYIFPLYKFKL